MTDMPDITIDKDVPYSQAEAKRQPKKTEPHPLEPKLRALSYGDSFFVPDQESKDVSHIARLGDRIGVYLQSKTVKKDGALEGVRTWRRTLDQLPPKRQERITTKVASGEFEPEDLSAIEERDAPAEAPTQDDNVGDLFWHHTAEGRYYRTRPGDDLTWMRENCEASTAEAYFDRPRYWVYSNGVKPVCTEVRSTADSLEESTLAEEVTEAEYEDALAAWGAANPDQTSGLRYFLNTETDTKIRATQVMAKKYVGEPERFVEISEAEYLGEETDGDAADDDLDDL